MTRKRKKRRKKILGNRKIKDRLFCYIFEQDRKALLQLYNGLNGTDYQDEQALQIVTLKDVVYMAMHNDVAFIIAGTLNLYEHQSTVCPNMPLRFFLYLAAEMEAIVESMEGNLYGSRLIRLPAPQCIVFYNGEQAMQEEQILRLTDAFGSEGGSCRDSCLELTVRVLNINHGHNRELMAYCRRLEEYSLFIGTIREYRREGYSMDQSIDLAVEDCIDRQVMADILIPFRAEVKKVLLTGYTEERVKKLLERDAIERGMQEGREQGIQEGRQEGIQQGRQEGRQQGIQQGRIGIIAAFLSNGGTEEEAGRLLNATAGEIAMAKNEQEKV